MTLWDNPEEWQKLQEGTTCPICLQGKPKDILVELPNTWITAGVEAPLPGYVCIVSKTHVAEPFELPQAGQAAFWQESMKVAKAISNLLQPIKVNYEIHGNTIPHLHLHFFPRMKGDPYVGGPIDSHKASFTRTPEDLERIKSAIQKLV